MEHVAIDLDSVYSIREEPPTRAYSARKQASSRSEACVFPFSAEPLKGVGPVCQDKEGR